MSRGEESSPVDRGSTIQQRGPYSIGSRETRGSSPHDRGFTNQHLRPPFNQRNTPVSVNADASGLSESGEDCPSDL
jgi:hypothetical protein